jgi:hypothetical protein
MTKFLHTGVLMLAVTVAGAGLASAATLRNLLALPANLATDEDREKVRQLITETLDNQPDGVSTNWRNPATDTSVVLRPSKSFQQDGLPCRRLQMRTRVGETTNDWAFNFCKVDGEGWKQAP